MVKFCAFLTLLAVFLVGGTARGAHIGSPPRPCDIELTEYFAEGAWLTMAEDMLNSYPPKASSGRAYTEEEIGQAARSLSKNLMTNRDIRPLFIRLWNERYEPKSLRHSERSAATGVLHSLSEEGQDRYRKTRWYVLASEPFLFGANETALYGIAPVLRLLQFGALSPSSLNAFATSVPTTKLNDEDFVKLNGALAFYSSHENTEVRNSELETFLLDRFGLIRPKGKQNTFELR